jgi:hypothetical protein
MNLEFIKIWIRRVQKKIEDKLVVLFKL